MRNKEAESGVLAEVQFWAIREGLRGTSTALLLEGFCQHLVDAGVPLWRGFAGMHTLHPQWGGYSYTWWRAQDTIEPQQLERGDDYDRDLRTSPFGELMLTARHPAYDPSRPLRVRRCLQGQGAQLDFPVLERLAREGATDYVAELFSFGVGGHPARGTGIGYSFATDCPDGFSDSDLALIQGALPALSLAIMADIEHEIAAGLLAAYLGEDAGRRVHEGAVLRGSVESIRAVLWFADLRGFTPIADATPGAAVIEMLDEVFEALTAALRSRGGQVLKFLGDGMLAIFPLAGPEPAETCRCAVEAARAGTDAIERLNAARRQSGKPAPAVDLALHLGDVLYGNVGAVDRLDFTVIGPAVNEVARIETLCEPLDRAVLVSAAFAAALRDEAQLEYMGAHRLRGVREAKDVYALRR